MKKYGVLSIIAALILGALLFGLFWMNRGEIMQNEMENKAMKILPKFENSRYKEIYLAGGCFWGTQAYLDQIVGVLYTNVGYANGDSDKTDYYSIASTGHAETVYIAYDPGIITLKELLNYYYGTIDPTMLNQQGNDRGTQYRTGIYYIDKEDLAIIQEVKQDQQKKHKTPLVVEVEELKNYVLAEDNHQDYLDKNPGGYCHVDLTNIPEKKPIIRAEDYPKLSKEELKDKLTDLQYSITQEENTEHPFDNLYWDNKEVGLYVDISTGEPLFLSSDKYDSGSGWPSFTKPIQWDVVTYKIDGSLGVERVEVRSRSGDAHLGHLFYDGPKSEGGLRYCMNSGSLEFIPLNEFETKGYEKFRIFFD